MTARRLALPLAFAVVLPLLVDDAFAGHRRSYSHRVYHRSHGHGHGDGWGFGLGLAVGALAVGVLSPEPVVVYEPRYRYRDRYGYPDGYYPSYVTPVVHGSIDTEVRPRSAAVYIDGVPVGTAGDFDGWPAHLHAAPGSHTLEFRAPGYRPARFTVEVFPRRTVEVRHELAPRGDTRAYRLEPEDEDDAPIRDEDDRELPPVRPRSPRPASEEPAQRPATATPDDPKDGATLRLEVAPADASVYVDGRLLGAGENGARYVLALAAGAHRIEVVKPGYDLFSGEVRMRRGQSQELDVRLVARAR